MLFSPNQFWFIVIEKLPPLQTSIQVCKQIKSKNQQMGFLQGPLNIYLCLYMQKLLLLQLLLLVETGTTSFKGFGCLDKGFNILTTYVIPFWNLWHYRTSQIYHASKAQWPWPSRTTIYIANQGNNCRQIFFFREHRRKHRI